jgi:hypothetical protein
LKWADWVTGIARPRNCSAFGPVRLITLVVAAGTRKSENLSLPEEFSRKTAAKVLVGGDVDNGDIAA